MQKCDLINSRFVMFRYNLFNLEGHRSLRNFRFLFDVHIVELIRAKKRFNIKIINIIAFKKRF